MRYLELNSPALEGGVMLAFVRSNFLSVVADAICDRLTNGSHMIQLKGDSYRRKKKTEYPGGFSGIYTNFARNFK